MSTTPIKAQWIIELACECPRCRVYVDLARAPDFWDGRKLAAGEHETPNSRGVKVDCPECGHAFTVDLEY